jgi:type IX secretion system PorP/SprF family membrane protein
MQKLLIILAFLLGTLACTAQHQPLYSHYMLNGLVVNPAYTGSRGVFTANAMHRRQWASFEGAPISQVVSIHGPTKRERLAFGLLVANDRHGVTANTSLSFSIAYRLKLGEKKSLAFAISGGPQFTTVKFTDVVTVDPNDPAFSNNLRSRILPDIGTGLYYSAPRMFAGISVPGFFKRTYNVADESVRATVDTENINLIVHAGYIIGVNENIDIKTSALFRYINYNSRTIDLNAIFQYKDHIGAGISWRIDNSLVALLEYQINKQFKLGYAFDYGTGALRSFNAGSHEINLQYEFGFKIKSLNPREIF